MSKPSRRAGRGKCRERRGVALVTVLYFLTVCAVTVAGLLFTHRMATRNTLATNLAGQLLNAAEAAAYGSVAQWDGVSRDRQPIGATTHLSRQDDEMAIDVYITRASLRVFSIVANASEPGGIARRTELLVRTPLFLPPLASALVSAVDVTIGPGVRFVSDSACGDSAVGITLAPGRSLNVDPGLAPGDQPSTRTNPIAADSATYLQVGQLWWTDLTRGADIVLPHDSHVAPAPVTASGTCVSRAENWGDPATTSSACAAHAVVIYAPGDLTIDGGLGQGVLLVDGHLVIAGPFTFSGQIVARHGIETRADNIAISGVVYAWRGSSDSTASRATSNEITLTHATTLRASRCDAGHGIASWLQPRRVRQRASAELF